MTASSPADKRAYYRRESVARGYLERRYGGAAGRRVLDRETVCVRDLLGRVAGAGRTHGRVLDIACGPGRAAAVLTEGSWRAFGLDASVEMLTAGPAHPGRAVAGDALALPFRTGAFDAALALRFTFHLPDLRPFLAEAARVLRPGGGIVFETYRWSLLVSGRGPFRWAGGPNYHRSDAEVEALLARAGFEPVDRVDAFAVPPSLIRWLGPLAPLALAAEAAVPRRLRVASYWAARRR